MRLDFETKMKLAQTNLSELANGGMTVAPASWTAPVLWRFSRAGRKAAEGCRSPKPCGISGAAFDLSRRDSLKIARRFNAGIGLDCASSPVGTAENARPFRPSLRDKIPARQTNLSQLRRSDLFVENRLVQDSQLRRSGIFGIQRKDAKAQRRQQTTKNFFAALRLCALALKNDVAPTELKNLLMALTTKIPLLRSYKMAQTTNLSRRDSLKTARRFNAGIGLDSASSPGGTAENARPFRPSLRDKIPARRTNLSQLRRSDLFVENRLVQDSQLRRSGIFGGARLLTSRLPFARNGSRGRSPHQNNDVAPTELKNLWVAFTTKIPLLRSYEPALAHR